MFEKGRLCTKIAGRDAMKKCVIIKVIDDKFVMIDGQTRRRKCNIKHIEPSNKVLKIGENADHAEVKKILKKEKIEVVDTKPKNKKTTKPNTKRKTKKVSKNHQKNHSLHVVFLHSLSVGFETGFCFFILTVKKEEFKVEKKSLISCVITVIKFEKRERNILY